MAFTTVLSPSGEFTFDAPPFETQALLEVEPAELSRMLSTRELPLLDEDAPAFWNSVHDSHENLTPWHREIRIRGVRTGREIWARVHAIPTRLPDGSTVWKGMLFEVTDLKNTQERLWKAYQQLSSHMDNSPMAVVEWEGESGKILRWSEQSHHLFGWAASEVVGRSFVDFPFLHPDDSERIRLLMKDMVAKRTLRSRAVNRNLTKDGQVLTCEWYNSVVFDEGGKIVTVLSLGLDISERVKTETALARSEGLLRAAVEAAHMFVWEWDLLTNRIEYSVDFATFYHLPRDVDYSHPDRAAKAMHPHDEARVIALMNQVLANDRSFQFQFRGASPAADGGERWFVSRGQVLRDEAGMPIRVLAVTFDVTEHQRIDHQRASFEKQLQETQKLELLGVLAGGIAHDFNNLLTIVLGNSSLTRKQVPENAKAQDYLDQIDSACLRATSLCRQMLAYAGRGAISMVKMNLNQVIRESSALIGMSADSSVRIDTTLQEPLPDVIADVPQVRQVLMNLVMNGAEAAASVSGGRVFVRTGVVNLSSNEVGPGYHKPPTPGRYVFLDVADNGPGMSDDVKTRMFDPFFTTKFVGRGLGLPAVLGIIRAHKGFIRVDSTPGRGTLVRVLWPIAASLPPVPKPSVVAASPARWDLMPQEHGLALIVDDEIFVREVAASSLEEIGLQSIIADNGEQGFQLFELHRSNLRVAVIDLILPGMGGGELAERIRQAQPDFPIVFISGFSDRILTGPIRGTGATLFLQKPFRPEELMTAVREALHTTT